jgi:hypothetical protein
LTDRDEHILSWCETKMIGPTKWYLIKQCTLGEPDTDGLSCLDNGHAVRLPVKLGGFAEDFRQILDIDTIIVLVSTHHFWCLLNVMCLLALCSFGAPI